MELAERFSKKEGHVLIVDDESKVVEEGLANVLDSYIITSANSGKEAIKRLEERTFDVVILDMKMPEMSGLEVLAKVQKMHKDIPVIIHTGFPGDYPEEMVKGFHPFSYVVKGDIDTLVSDVRKAIEFYRTYIFRLHQSIIRAKANGDTCPYTIFYHEFVDPLTAKDLPKKRNQAEAKMRYGDEPYCRISTILEHQLADQNLRLCPHWDNHSATKEKPELGLRSRKCTYYVNKSGSAKKE